MPRPTKPRWVEFYPNVTYFKPAGVLMRELEEVCLGVDEVEALRLKDGVGMEQEECAERMNLAQSTFQRILATARGKVADALIQGKALRIEGGNFIISPLKLKCNQCEREWENDRRGPLERVCPFCGSTGVSIGERHGPETPPDSCPGRGRGGGWRRRNGPGGCGGFGIGF